MLVSPETVEFTKELNSPYCNGCRINHLPGKHLTLDEVDKNHILAVYEATGHNKMQTAAILGIDRNTLKARLARYWVVSEICVKP